MKKYYKYIFIWVSVGFYLLSLLFYKLDHNFTYRWLTFCISLVPVTVVSITWLLSLQINKKVFNDFNVLGFVAIVMIATIVSCFSLTIYPFVSVGDELRDGGLFAQRILSGQIKDLFGYGSYNSQGLIIATITALFYKILGVSVLVYRLPAAIISILDSVLLYILLTKVTNHKTASFLGALVLILMPLHVYYGRTEVVVIMSSFLATLLICSLYVFIRRRMTNLVDYVFMGTLLGFTFNFHGAIKAFSIVLLSFIILIVFYQLLTRRMRLKQVLVRLIILTVFLFVGFGPRLLNTSSIGIFLNSYRLPIASEETLKLTSSFVSDIGTKYVRSILVWIKEPTMAWYPDHRPIFSPQIFIFMFIGLLVSIFRRNIFLIVVTVVALVIHMSNSAITDMLNGDHRLSPLFSTGALFVGVGIAFVIDKTKFKYPRYLFVLLVLVILFHQVVMMIVSKPVNIGKDVGAYLSMNTIYFLKSNEALFKTEKEIILVVSTSNFERFNTGHYKEQRDYFFPNKDFLIEQNVMMGDNELYIRDASGGSSGRRHIINCDGKSLYCPTNYMQQLIINY